MYAIVNGLKLFYHKEGSGRPVILLHGNGEDHTIFDVAIRDLARSYTVYALDSRAHGKSDPVPSLTYREMAEDVAAFIRQQGLETVSYTHLTLPTIYPKCRSRWSPYH